MAKQNKKTNDSMYKAALRLIKEHGETRVQEALDGEVKDAFMDLAHTTNKMGPTAQIPCLLEHDYSEERLSEIITEYWDTPTPE